VHSKILARKILAGRKSEIIRRRPAMIEEVGRRKDAIPETMRAVRLHSPGSLSDLVVEDVDVPTPGPGEALVRIHAAAITRDELTWPLDRLPATPSYELSGVVAAVGPGAQDVGAGDAVYALTPFDRDGAAAGFAVVPTACLAPKPRSLGDAETAALPLAGLSAWQGLFVHGGLEHGERVLIHGAAGGVGHLATQLARWRGAYVVGTATGSGVEAAKAFGADEVIDGSSARFEDAIEPVDLVFDTVGGDALGRSGSVLREGGRVVSIAEEPPEGMAATYFVVEPDRDQLVVLARLVDDGAVRTSIDSVFPLEDAAKAFERLTAPGKRGKVVLEIRP
jgi:NADPH:quinone reductase-like Zn-dependent oxidoreductase